MIILKCNMCGGDIVVSPDKTFGTCEFCGSTATLPKVDNEQRAAIFNRGNDFRRIGEFDKALEIYEHIVMENDMDAEAHWGCALSRFGIEYVEDPNTYERIPTCHRASFDSILEDVDYKATIKYSEGITRRLYQKEAARIAQVQREILELSQKSEPFDVFISFKNTDDAGNPTPDSMLAQDIYYKLVGEGYRVFFSRVTLMEVAGEKYEPYIFSALNSAKIMLVIGTKKEYMEATWVKNEWSRFLALKKKDNSKVLFPCYRDMNPNEMPERLRTQAFDMSRITFMEDLLNCVSKISDKKKSVPKESEPIIIQQTHNTNVNALLERGYIALEDKEWNKANDFFEQVLNQDAKNASAYLGKVFAQVCVSDLKQFVQNRKNLKWNFEKEELMIEENRNLIEEVVEKYVIPSFLERKDVSKQFYYNRRYYSTVLSKKKRCEAEKTYWKNDKNLIRAVKFSTGELKKQLDDGYKNIIGYLEQEVILAEKTKELERKNTEEAYGKYLENTKKKIESMYKEAFQHREDMYREACRLLSEIREQIVNDDVRKWKTDIDIEPIKARTISQIDEIQNKFLILGSYQDSLAFVKECDLLKANVEEKVKEFEKRVEKRNDRIGIVIGLGFTACLVILIILKNFMGL